MEKNEKSSCVGAKLLFFIIEYTNVWRSGFPHCLGFFPMFYEAFPSMDLFSFCVLFSFSDHVMLLKGVSSYARANVNIIYEKTKRKIPMMAFVSQVWDTCPLRLRDRYLKLGSQKPSPGRNLSDCRLKRPSDTASGGIALRLDFFFSFLRMRSFSRTEVLTILTGKICN